MPSMQITERPNGQSLLNQNGLELVYIRWCRIYQFLCDQSIGRQRDLVGTLYQSSKSAIHDHR